MQPKMKGYLLCLLGVYCWSFSEIIVKLLQGSVGPLALSFIRFFFGGFFLLFIMILLRDLRNLSVFFKKYFVLMLIACMFGSGISNVLFFMGVQMTQANTGSALYTTYPIFVSIYSIFILRENSNILRKMIGYVIGFIGILILLTNFQINLIFQPVNIAGNLFLVAAAMIWSLYSVIGKWIFKREPGIKNVEIKFTMLGFFLACVPILLLLPSSSTEMTTFFQYTPVEWGIMLFLAFVGTAFGSFIFFIGVRNLEMSQGISLALLKPIMVTISAFFILAEPVTLALVVSIALISFSVLLINSRSKKKTDTVLLQSEVTIIGETDISADNH